MKVMRSRGILFILIMASGLFISPASGEQKPERHLVVIDPAHGGSDRGVQLSDREAEKDITLKIALALQKELLANRSIQVQLTRTADVDMSMAERIKYVRASGAALFVSLHANAGFDKKATGYEVYFPGFNFTPSNRNGASEIVKNMTETKYLNDSVALAQAILRNLQDVFPRKGRGLREAPLSLLESLSLPAVVVEMGFITNPEDKRTLTDETGRRMISQALGKSIKDFFHIY